MPPPARPPAPRAATTQPSVGISAGNLMPHVPAQPYTNASVFGDERQKSTTPKSGGGGKQKKKKINKNEISMPTDFQFCLQAIRSKFTNFSLLRHRVHLGWDQEIGMSMSGGRETDDPTIQRLLQELGMDVTEHGVRSWFPVFAVYDRINL